MLGSKKDRLIEFQTWAKNLSENAKYSIDFEKDSLKHLKLHIMNPNNMKRIKRNIEYIINDPLNLKNEAPNDWHRLTYIKRENKIVYTMDINGKDRMAYIVKDNVVIFSMLEHQ